MRSLLASFGLWLSFTACVASEPMLMASGTWSLDIQRDPFANSFPVVAYLPAGTIIFDTAPGNYNSAHILGLTQHGFWIQIPRSENGGPSLIPISSFGLKIPSEAVFFHQSVLCLSQTNIIVEPDELCENGNLRSPVGEGWIFQYQKSDRPNWVSLSASLDENTKAQLQARGWDVLEAAFDMKADDLSELENLGRVTTLERNYPVVSLFNRGVEPILIRCGTKTVTAQELKAGISAEASVEAKASFFTWMSGQLKIAARSDAQASEKYTVEVDTTQSSYLYFSVKGLDHQRNEEFIIRVVKEFDCRSGARVDFGDKLTSITFDLEFFGGSDPLSVRLDNPSMFAPVPDQLYDIHNKRPLFVSLNTAWDYLRAVETIMKEYGISNKRLAEYMISQINYTCPSAQRSKCAEISSAAESHPVSN